MPHKSSRGKSSGAACPLLQALKRGHWSVPGQGTEAAVILPSRIDRNRGNSAALVTSVEAVMLTGWFLLLGGFCPVLYANYLGQLEHSGRAAQSLPVNSTSEPVVSDAAAVNADNT